MMRSTGSAGAAVVVVGVVGVVALALGCSSDDASTGDAPTVTQAAPAATTPATAAPSVDEVGDSAEAPATTTDAPTTTTQPELPMVLPGFSDEIILTTPFEGGGARPLLGWEPVDGADHYGVYLYAPDGAIYWSWQGESTEVHVGGEQQLPDTAPGPSVIPGMTWAVVAYDDDQLPVGASRLTPISP